MNGQSDPRVASSLRSAPWFIVSFLLTGLGFVLLRTGPDTSLLNLFGLVLAALRPETLFTPVWALLVYCFTRMILPGWMFGKHASGAMIAGSSSFLLLVAVYHHYVVPFLAARRGVSFQEQDSWVGFQLATAISTLLALLIECCLIKIVKLKGAN